MSRRVMSETSFHSPAFMFNVDTSLEGTNRLHRDSRSSRRCTPSRTVRSTSDTIRHCDPRARNVASNRGTSVCMDLVTSTREGRQRRRGRGLRGSDRRRRGNRRGWGSSCRGGSVSSRRGRRRRRNRRGWRGRCRGGSASSRCSNCRGRSASSRRGRCRGGSASSRRHAGCLCLGSCRGSRRSRRGHHRLCGHGRHDRFEVPGHRRHPHSFGRCVPKARRPVRRHTRWSEVDVFFRRQGRGQLWGGKLTCDLNLIDRGHQRAK